MLGEGIFAAYLLGYDESKKETSISFAEGDDDKLVEKAGPAELRFDVPPREAIDYFRRKKIFSEDELAELEAEARSAAFKISEVYEKDVLQAFKDEILGALETGTPQKTIVKNLKSILTGSGHKMLGNFHLETIVRSNMMTAYGVGRRRQMQEVSDLLPFWEYSAVNDDRTRPAHRACDGVILPADSPFWDEHYPPWGFNCRCTIIARLDIPSGYDLTKPNNDTLLALDSDGIPVKASYGTGVHDLGAGTFTGIPNQAGLKETFDAIDAQREK